MLSRLIQRRIVASLNKQTTSSASTRSVPSPLTKSLQRRWMTPAPKAGDGPLMARRADRELPDLGEVTFQWRRTMPIFVALIAVASVAIFNYQKMSSPIVSSTLYALRTNPRARELLGDEIYFKHQIPWIRGQMNQLQGKINIYFTVKGSKGTATMRFTSNRKTSRGFFETTEWSLVTESGEKLNLLEEGDPFKGLLGGEEEEMLAVEAGEDQAGRGYRQQSPYK